MIKSEVHKCDAKPDALISRQSIDGRWTEWSVYATASSRHVQTTASIFVRFCPYCGKELDG